MKLKGTLLSSALLMLVLVTAVFYAQLLGHGYLMFSNLNQVILPYENAGWLLFYSFGFIKIDEFVKFMSIRMVIHLIYCFIVLIPYWSLIGIL